MREDNIHVRECQRLKSGLDEANDIIKKLRLELVKQNVANGSLHQKISEQDAQLFDRYQLDMVNRTQIQTLYNVVSDQEEKIKKLERELHQVKQQKIIFEEKHDKAQARIQVLEEQDGAKVNKIKQQRVLLDQYGLDQIACKEYLTLMTECFVNEDFSKVRSTSKLTTNKDENALAIVQEIAKVMALIEGKLTDLQFAAKNQFAEIKTYLRSMFDENMTNFGTFVDEKASRNKVIRTSQTDRNFNGVGAENVYIEKANQKTEDSFSSSRLPCGGKRKLKNDNERSPYKKVIIMSPHVNERKLPALGWSCPKCSRKFKAVKCYKKHVLSCQSKKWKTNDSNDGVSHQFISDITDISGNREPKNNK